MTVSFRSASAEDAKWFAPRLRAADRQEIIAATGETPDLTLRASVAMGDAMVGMVDDEPVALLGFPMMSLLPTTIRPWMVGTDQVEAHDRAVARASYEMVNLHRRRCDVMVNHVDGRNLKAIKWLGWLGFTIEEARPHGPYGVPFHRFFWVR